ncbi:MAG: HD-GYP domain-containing protein [Treponema sp.]|nr:HD-GYP domain-containing protein [Treponema sp.]
MESLKVAELQADNKYAADMMLDSQFLLNPAHCPLAQETMRALLDWNFDQVFISERIIATVSDEKVDIEAIKKKGPVEEKPVVKKITEEQRKVISASTEEVAVIDEPAKVDTPEKASAEFVYPGVKEALAAAEAKKDSINNDKERMELVQEVYNSYINFLNALYTRYATHKEFNTKEIYATVRSLCSFVEKHRRFVLRITPSAQDRNRNFLVYHGIRSTVLAVTIGLQLKIEKEKLTELGVACLLHEIGMLRISPQLYMNNKPLTVAERTQILTHPIISYNILKEASFPLPILLGVLDHHERENGTGYPRHIKASAVSFYGKIITVACSFEAITAPREFKEARSPYEAMIEMLKNENHQYDDTVVKALLYSLSLFPIGAFVYLANGRIAQVVDVNPSDPRNPVVQILGQSNPDGTPMILQTNGTDIKISRVMDKKEATDVVAALKKLG